MQIIKPSYAQLRYLQSIRDQENETGVWQWVNNAPRRENG